MVAALLMSGSNFSGSLGTLFAPMSGEYNLATKHPQSETTLKNIEVYQRLMEEVQGQLEDLDDILMHS